MLQDHITMITEFKKHNTNNQQQIKVKWQLSLITEMQYHFQFLALKLNAYIPFSHLKVYLNLCQYMSWVTNDTERMK